MSDTLLILHVKGTQQDTTSLPKEAVRAAISQGQITHSQLIWSPTQNAWKQVRELPHLLPSQELAPAPLPRPANQPQVVAVAVEPQHSVAVEAPRVASLRPQAVSAVQPQVAVAASQPQPRPSISKSEPVPRPSAVKPSVRVSQGGQGTKQDGKPSPKKTQSLVVEEEHGSHPIKWICLAAGLIVVIALVVNYFLVDLPLVSRMNQTAFAKVSVFGHLGGFMEPRVLLIHIPVGDKITKANFSAFLVALARSTPTAPLSNSPFDTVDLTDRWTGRYTFTGENWKKIGEMGRSDEATREEFVADTICDATGDPLFLNKSTWSDTYKHDQRQQVWTDLVDQFTR